MDLSTQDALRLWGEGGFSFDIVAFGFHLAFGL